MPAVQTRNFTSPNTPLLSNTRFSATLFRHLLRALLREATYLPDPAARQYFRAHILDRFRAYRLPRSRITDLQRRGLIRGREHGGALYSSETAWEADTRMLRKQARPAEKQAELLKKGRQKLRWLARANLGHEQSLMRVLMNAYGRTGERRYGLLYSFWAPDLGSPRKHEISDSEGVEKVLKELQGNHDGHDDENGKEGAVLKKEVDTEAEVPAMWTDPRPGREPQHIEIEGQLPPRPVQPRLPDRINAILLAQMTSGLEASVSKFTTSPTEMKNIWNRTLPVRRQRNAIRKWKTEIRERLLPPLPPKEHERLVNLINNTADKNDPSMKLCVPKRRKMCTAQSFPTLTAASTASSEDASLNGYNAKGPSISESQIPDESDIDGVLSLLIPTDGVHAITPRFMRRCLQRVLALTPSVERMQNGRWKARFGPEEDKWKLLYHDAVRLAREKAAKRQSAPKPAGGTHESAAADAVENGKVVRKKSWMFELGEGAVEPAITLSKKNMIRTQSSKEMARQKIAERILQQPDGN